MVDEQLAAKFWPGQDPIGRRMWEPNSSEQLVVNEKTQFRTVVGVVRSVRMIDLTNRVQPVGAVYFPYNQRPRRTFTLALRSAQEGEAVASAMRKTIAMIDPSLALFDIKTMNQRMDLTMAPRRAAMSLALAFSVVAVFLAAVGIYGVLAYLVSQRKKEIGIRIAVGSSQAGIFQLFLNEGVRLVVGGLAIGLSGALVLQRAIESQLYGVHPLEPTVLAMVVVLMGVVAMVASLWPARQAMQVDPLVVLSE
jgi:predicted lysophospholipase L1 biosynthesis ABC-type transport system permease subunit